MIDVLIKGGCGVPDLHYCFSMLVYEGIPIISVCKDNAGQLYLVLCSEIRGMQRWIVNPTVKYVLNKIYDKSITVYDGLKCGDCKKFLVTRIDGDVWNYEIVPFDEIDELDLPDKDAKLEYSCGGASEEIQKLEEESK